MSGTTLPLRAVPTRRYNGTIGAIFSNDVPEAAKIYLQTVLNGLTQKLSPYLVRDIERVFLDSDLLLPIKEDGTIDYDWMAEYTNTGERKLKSILKEWIELED